jgi:hypothetical protein
MSTDTPGHAEHDLGIPSFGLFQQHLLGHFSRSIGSLWRILPWHGLCYELAFGMRAAIMFSVSALTDRLDGNVQISWIGSADMPLAHISKIEDARTGQWLRHLDPVTDPVVRIDMGWTMGDWNQLDVGVETTTLRGCRLVQRLPDVLPN